MPSPLKKAKHNNDVMTEEHSIAPTNQQLVQDTFDTDPVIFLDDVINSLEDYVCDNLDALEKKIVADTNMRDVREKKSLGKGIDALHNKLQTRYERNFDKFELIVLQHTFKPPQGLDNGEVGPTEEEDKELTDEVADLYQRLSGAQHAHRALKRELRSRQAKIDRLKRVSVLVSGEQDEAGNGSLLAVVDTPMVERVAKVVESAGALIDRVGELDSLNAQTQGSLSSSSANNNSSSGGGRKNYSNFVNDVATTGIPLGQASTLSALMKNAR